MFGKEMLVVLSWNLAISNAVEDTSQIRVFLIMATCWAHPIFSKQVDLIFFDSDCVTLSCLLDTLFN